MFKKCSDHMGQGEDARLPVPPFKPVPFPSDPAALPSGSVMLQRRDFVGDLPSGSASWHCNNDKRCEGRDLETHFLFPASPSLGRWDLPFTSLVPRSLS